MKEKEVYKAIITYDRGWQSDYIKTYEPFDSKEDINEKFSVGDINVIKLNKNGLKETGTIKKITIRKSR